MKDACLRKNKSISIDPIRVLRIEGHELIEENMGHWGHAHRGTGMSGIRCEGGIDLGGRNHISKL